MKQAQVETEIIYTFDSFSVSRVESLYFLFLKKSTICNNKKEYIYKLYLILAYYSELWSFDLIL